MRQECMRLRGAARPRGFTLVEMMIALVITLMIVFAMVEAFRWIGDATTDGRAAIEMLGQMRHARTRLEDDLIRCTVPTTPWRTTSGNDAGYIEVVEGIGFDGNPGGFFVRNSATGLRVFTAFDFANPPNSGYATIFGDLDDILMFTARNDEVPFRGRYQGVIIESNLAEIIWWAELNDTNGNNTWDPGELFTVRRRALLIRPDLNEPSLRYLATAGNNAAQFLVDNDVSVHQHIDAAGNYYLAANSLGDLTYRHNRTAHVPINAAIVNGNGQPRGLSSAAPALMSPLDTAQLPAFSTLAPDLVGEDVVLAGVTAFDLRVWDPTVNIRSYAGPDAFEGLVPGDPGYNLPTSTNVGQGGFIDLGIGETLALSPAVTSGLFTGAMHPRSYLVGNMNHVYDPWTINYEKDGYDQDGNGVIDQGTNGLDENGVNGPDDILERETSPPYPHPLQSIQVRIRMYEPSTRQVRQTSQVIKFRTE